MVPYVVHATIRLLLTVPMAIVEVAAMDLAVRDMKTLKNPVKKKRKRRMMQNVMNAIK